MSANLVAMLVDDDQFQLEFVGDMLRELGVENVLLAASGEEALEMFDQQARKPDLMLCDLNMHGMDGIELMRQLVEREYQGCIGVLSGVGADLRKAADTLTRAYGLNLLGVVEKPAKRENLLALLNQINNRPLTQSAREIEQPLTVEDIREGLSKGHLEVFFQPKVAITQRLMVGTECLARWNHPVRGLLGPHTFIAVAEENGLADELTLAVLSKALEHMVQWRKQGNHFKVAINISAYSLNRLDLPETIQQLVHDAGIDSNQLIFEITEGGVMKDFRLSLDILTRLRLKGFGLSVDDFGTGYSNLEKLKRLPFTELKLDRAFVCGAKSDQATLAILEASVHLGHALGLNLVAEGVETQDDWGMVERLGCNEVQGYFVAKPMPATDLINWKNQWEGRVEPERLPIILSVDDDSVAREMVCDGLSGAFHMHEAENGQACLNMLHNNQVDLVLLDVEMPALDGYETCRRIKADTAIADIPVVFLSGYDRIESRLKGYEAGGDDYIVKPCDLVELESKIRNLLRLRRERDQHKEMAVYATSAAMTAMANLGEMGSLIEAMKKFSTCNTLVALADSCVSGLALYGLEGAVQIRSGSEKVTRSADGEASPLLTSIINHMASMERITSYKTRMSVTYEHVSLLISNMPVHDPDRCGRLRDHLAMLAEGANTQTQAIQVGSTLQRVALGLTGTLARIDEAQRRSRMNITLGLNALNVSIAAAYVSLGLTDSQEEFMSKTIEDGIDSILNTELSSVNIQDELSALVKELKGVHMDSGAIGG